jgi:hypothetical protein
MGVEHFQYFQPRQRSPVAGQENSRDRLQLCTMAPGDVAITFKYCPSINDFVPIMSALKFGKVSSTAHCNIPSQIFMAVSHNSTLHFKTSYSFAE